MNINRPFRKKDIIWVVFLVFIFGTMFFVREVIGIKNSSECKSIELIIFTLTFLIFTFFEQYFKIPKNERSFAEAYRSWICWLNSDGKNNKS